MPIQSFEYCSMHYLNQWILRDQRFCEALANGDRTKKLEALKEAAGFYRVARNLRTGKKKDSIENRYGPVLNLLDSVVASQYLVDPAAKVLKFEKNIKNLYEGNNVLSLTTKFLWIRLKSPVIIYDSQARDALGFKKCALTDYYDEWRNVFDGHYRDIRAACTKLPDLKPYVINGESMTKKKIRELASENWFRERVFDMYLWNKGNKAY